MWLLKLWRWLRAGPTGYELALRDCKMRDAQHGVALARLQDLRQRYAQVQKWNTEHMVTAATLGDEVAALEEEKDDLVAAIKTAVEDIRAAITRWEYEDGDDVPPFTCPEINSVIKSIEDAQGHLRVAFTEQELEDCQGSVQYAQDHLSDIDMEDIRTANSELRNAADAGSRLKDKLDEIVEEMEDNYE